MSAIAVIAFAGASSGCVLSECPTPDTIDHRAEDHVSLTWGVYGLVYEPGTTSDSGCDEGEHVWRLSRVRLEDVTAMEVTDDLSDFYGAYEITPPAAGMYNLCKDDVCLAVMLTTDTCVRVDVKHHDEDGLELVALEPRESAQCP